MAAALGAAAALLGVAFHDVATQHDRLGSAWSDVIQRYRQREHTIPDLVAVVKTAGGIDTAKLEAAWLTLAKVPVPDEPDEESGFHHWEQAEINVSVALADLFRTIPGTTELRRNGDYVIALSHLEGTESAIDEATARYNHTVTTYEAAIAGGVETVVATLLFPRSAGWETFTAFHDYGPLDEGKRADD